MDIKDFIKEGQASKQQIIEQQTKPKSKTIPMYTTILENDSDFVLERETATTDRMLVCILSQGLIYFKDVKKNKIQNSFTLGEITRFITECPIADRPKSLKYSLTDGCSKLSEYLKWAINHLEESKTCVNNKLFINPSELKAKPYKVIDLNLNDLIWVANNLVPPAQVQYSYKSQLSNAYLWFQNMQRLNVNKDKIKYNLDKLIELGRPYLNYSNYSNHMALAIEKGHLEFNNFVDYMIKLYRTEGLDVTVNYEHEFSFPEYCDYLNMQIEMYGKVKEKYPNNWLTSLKLMKTKYNKWKQLHKDERFLAQAEKYKDLEYKDNKYCIIIPTKANEIVDEGYRLGHCVGSYVDRIINGNTFILFMRKVNSPEESLVTIELKEGKVCQYKGRGDRAVTKEEDDFLVKWCEEKNLEKAERG